MQTQQKSKLQSTRASFNTALAPIQKHIQPLSVRTLGVSRFINIRDLMFVFENEDKPFLSQYKQYMDNLKYKLYASWFIFPISLLANVKLQRMFPNSFGGKRFYNFLIDMVWWTATTYLMVLMNEQLPREPNFQQIKDSLLAQQNPEYLLHMHENYSKYKIEFADQIGKHRPYTNPQILNLSWKARDLAQQKKKANKNVDGNQKKQVV